MVIVVAVVYNATVSVVAVDSSATVIVLVILNI